MAGEETGQNIGALGEPDPELVSGYANQFWQHSSQQDRLTWLEKRVPDRDEQLAVRTSAYGLVIEQVADIAEQREEQIEHHTQFFSDVTQAIEDIADIVEAESELAQQLLDLQREPFDSESPPDQE